MQLANFLNKIFKKGGFILTDANSKDYIIGQPTKNPIRLKLKKALTKTSKKLKETRDKPIGT